MTHGRTFVKAGPSAAAVRREAHLRCKEIGSEPAYALALTPRPVPRLPSCFAKGAHRAARPSAQGGSPRDRTSVRSHSGYRDWAQIFGYGASVWRSAEPSIGRDKRFEGCCYSVRRFCRACPCNGTSGILRSEERRVGKEGRSR